MGDREALVPKVRIRKQVEDSACQARGCALLVSVCPCFVEVPERFDVPLLSIDVQEMCFYVHLQPKQDTRYLVD